MILTINASPRRDGNIWRILDAAEATLRESGNEIQRINLCDKHFAFCTGCMRCRTASQCSLPVDDAHRIADLILHAEALIIAAPTYWANIPAQLKALFDRTVYALIDTSGPGRIPTPLHRGRKAMIITACTTPWPWSGLLRQSSGMIAALRRILKPAGFKILPPVVLTGTYSPHFNPDKAKSIASATAAKLLKKSHSPYPPHKKKLAD